MPAGKPGHAREEFDLHERQVIVLAGWSLPNPRTWQNVIKARALGDDQYSPGRLLVEIEARLVPGHRPGAVRRCRSDRGRSPGSRPGAGIPPQPAKRLTTGSMILLVPAPLSLWDATRLIPLVLTDLRRPVDRIWAL